MVHRQNSTAADKSYACTPSEEQPLVVMREDGTVGQRYSQGMVIIYYGASGRVCCARNREIISLITGKTVNGILVIKKTVGNSNFRRICILLTYEVFLLLLGFSTSII